MVKGDGTFEKGRMRKFYSTSYKLIDGMQEVLLKLGYSTIVSEYRNTGFSKDKVYHLNISKEKVLGSWPKEKYYKGDVYCVTVSNHVILVRRNGKIAWSGNCGYHGWHDWYLAANVGTENALGEYLIPGLISTGVPKALKGTAQTFKYNDINSLKTVVAAHKGKIAAIIMEPVRSAQPVAGFLEGVRRLADKEGAVFIIDEISAGFRMNCGGAHLTYGIKPDIAVFSKALGNGYPIAAIIGRACVMESAQKSFISSTMWTERIGPVAGLATIRKFQAVKAHEHLIEIGYAVQEGWEAVSKRHGLPIKISGIYPLSHFVFDDQEHLVMKAFFVQEMLAKGFLASNLFYSMFAHTKKHVAAYLIAVDEVFGSIRLLKDTCRLRSALKGDPSAAGFKRIT
ncbi:MAG: aminotransferase class III-fold pyridoxal phosphate-dependent enzyme [Candidatus Omnitrophota bacterium]|nr:aminotransferase class III-fold pyridoxal phosphate-dependent enzyme [Candidatus Omnitrophota bacterium]